jgi:hypothetical protein
MRKSVIVGLGALCAVLSGCGGGTDQAGTATSSAAASSASADDYRAEVEQAFRAAYPDTPRYEGDFGEASDWSAFVSVITDLQPPSGVKSAHEQMVAAFQAYVEADKDAEAVCVRTPGPGGPCFTAVSAARDRWTVAMQRTTAATGLSAQSLQS